MHPLAAMTMPNDPVLIERIRALAHAGTTEKQVFGARCWVLDGNMAYGVHEDRLLVRLGPDADPGPATGFDPMGSGRPMKGWYLVAQDELAEDTDVEAWIDRAHAFAATLAPK